MMIQPIPRHFLNQLKQLDLQARPLEAVIKRELTAGRLKPGDPLLSPEQLARQFKILPVDVLDSISQLLARGVLRQNRNGDLFIAGGNSGQDLPDQDQQVA